jgi:hypothetical protein
LRQNELLGDSADLKVTAPVELFLAVDKSSADGVRHHCGDQDERQAGDQTERPQEDPHHSRSTSAASI